MCDILCEDYAEIGRKPWAGHEALGISNLREDFYAYLDSILDRIGEQLAGRDAGWTQVDYDIVATAEHFDAGSESHLIFRDSFL